MPIALGCWSHAPACSIDFYIFTRLKRNAFIITETEEKLIAALARMGLNNIPKNGNRIPAAIGTPKLL